MRSVKFLSAIFAFFLNVSVAAAVGDYHLDQIPDDGVIGENVMLVGNIVLSEAMTVTNYGTIRANIDVCSGCELKIRVVAGGTITGNINLQPGAKLTQLISKDEDITSPNFGDTPFSVLVDGADNLSLDKIVGATSGASFIKLNGGRFTVDDVAAMHGVDFVLNGHIEIFISRAADLVDSVLLQNISGNGDVYVYADDLGPLHALRAYVDGDKNLIVGRIRILDYGQILHDSRGDFLNDLRRYDPSDKLLRALDGAETFGELNSIMARSVRLHPINLMRPVRMLDLAVQNRTLFDTSQNGAFVAPLILSGGEMDLYGVHAGITGRVYDDLIISVSGYGAMADYSDDINDFYAGLVGVNVAVQYDMEIAFIRALVGTDVAMFSLGPVLDGATVAFDPYGIAGYGLADIGRRFDVENLFYVSPFVGLGLRHEAVLSESSERTFARVGMDAGVKLDYGDLIYDYVMRVTGTTASSVAVDVRMSVWSPFDAAGGDFSVGIVREGDLRAYSFSVGTRFRF